MIIRYFFQNRETGGKFEIISIDPKAGTVTLRGEMASFVEQFDKAIGPAKTFDRYGYELVQEAVK